jgi:hypothetical protein
VAGVIVAVRTLRTIARQTKAVEESVKVIERQTKATEDSVKVIERQTIAIKDSVKLSEKTMILQFRPRVAITGELVHGITADAIASSKFLNFVVINEGTSKAHITDSRFVLKVIHFTVGRYDLFDDAVSLGELSLDPGQAETKRLAIGDDLAKDIQEEMKHATDKNWKGSKTIMFAAKLWYTDELGLTKSTAITAKLRSTSGTFPHKDGTSGFEYTT